MAEIKFKRDTQFRKQFFVPDSFAHPAKMDAQLLIWIVDKYTQVGETILDPMAGSGTTMLACTLGRNAVLVELEDKFCKMMADNWNEVRMRPQLGSRMGDCQIIQGDARQLEGLLIDKCIFSPPYAESNTTGRPDTYKGSHGPHSQVQNPEYRQSKENIGNLPYGQIDAVVTSPPYEGIEARDRSKESSFEREQSGKYPRRGDTNISKGYSVDSIITSPPYEGQIHPTHETVENVIAKSDPKHLGPYSQPMLVDGYGSAAGNIGNLKLDSYLEAMLQVYQQCHKILKPTGLMILVTKNFIRNKQVVRLDTDTIKLCEQAGFTYIERHYRKLPAQSFWRTIYYQKHPDVEQIKHEDVLVFTSCPNVKRDLKELI